MTRASVPARRRRSVWLRLALVGFTSACVNTPGPPPAIQVVPAAPSCTDLNDVTVGDVRELRLVLLYTEAAAASIFDIEAEIEKAVLEANDSFAASEIPVRLVLAHMEKVMLVEQADNFLLADLTSGTAPANAHGLRDRFHGDVVGLVRKGEGGMANIMDVPSMAHSDKAFMVFGLANISTRFTLAHELGHILGGVHDRGIAPEPRYAYAYPHVCRTCVVEGRTGWHTIMSGYVLIPSGVTKPIRYFSNPDLLYFGQPLGVNVGLTGAADNRRAFSYTASLAAAFRYTPAWFVSLRGEGPWFETKVDDAIIPQIAIGDFDGDSLSDVFRVDPASFEWFVSARATEPWKSLFVDPRKVPLQDLRFADFNADGKTDVFHADVVGKQWLIWTGAVGGWQVHNTVAAASGIPVSDLALGHLDSDGKADVFWANPATTTWSVAWAGQGNWLPLLTDASLTFATQQLRLADFDNDKVMDVFRVDVPAQSWFLSKSGTTVPWVTLNGPSTELDVDVTQLAIGDFNGDGSADVMKPTGSEWRIAWSGKGALQHLKSSCARIGDILLGDFDADSSVDVLRAWKRP